jgi:ligand-binding sensor domain-containing protein
MYNLLLYAQPSGLPPPVLIMGRQGLPQGFIAGLVQDEQGFIWMATRDGLCRYDGNRFKVFRLDCYGKTNKIFSFFILLF